MGNKIDPSCVQIVKHSKIKMEESGRKAIFLNPYNDEYTLIRVDGCVVKSGLRADWVIISNANNQVFVELKGKDVAHAIEQLESTIELFVKNAWVMPHRGALIMCQQVPKAMTRLQAATDRFRRLYGVRLKVSSSHFEFCANELCTKTA
jgi:hypothetical protein